jgi:hypothetical protein
MPAVREDATANVNLTPAIPDPDQPALADAALADLWLPLWRRPSLPHDPRQRIQSDRSVARQFACAEGHVAYSKFSAVAPEKPNFRAANARASRIN